MTYKNPSKMDNEELYNEYQKAKEFGPTLKLDEIMLEICDRWEGNYRENLNDKQ